MSNDEFWVVLEIQMAAGGVINTLSTAYNAEGNAQSAYYTVLAAAVISSIPYHAVYLISSRSGVQMMQIYDRR